jgi:tetratricopeptide (TPR) repeat protein
LDLDYYLNMGNREEVLRIARAWGRLEPWGTLAVNHAHVAFQNHRPTEVVEALADYDPYSPDLEWRRLEARDYWRHLSNAHHLLGNDELALESARKADEMHPNDWEAAVLEVQALAGLHRPNEVNRVLDRVRESGGAGSVGLVAGRELLIHGHPVEARAVFERTVQWCESQIPAESDRLRHQQRLGEALYGAQRWEEALAIFRALLAEDPADIDFENLGPRMSKMLALSWVARGAAHLGDTTTAQEIDAEIAAMAWGPRAWGQIWERAKLATVLGHSDEAVEFLRQVFSRQPSFSMSLHREIDFVSLQGREDFQELMRPKG